MEQVILVNEFDEHIGVMEKIEAHEKALLHRAISVFIFNSKGEMLLQQRSFKKYHSGGLWTNACCSHPRPNETVEAAAYRRVKEELGFETTLVKAFEFTYQASFDNGLSEYEFDHVFTGVFNGEVKINEQEVNDVTYKSLDEIELSLQLNPSKFTVWFHIAFPKLKEWLQTSSVQKH
jgi:isopentenyl-diphosphate delta-isomerase